MYGTMNLKFTMKITVLSGQWKQQIHQNIVTYLPEYMESHTKGRYSPKYRGSKKFECGHWRRWFVLNSEWRYECVWHSHWNNL